MTSIGLLVLAEAGSLDCSFSSIVREREGSSSLAFSADLRPLLAALPDAHPAWRRCYDRFHAALGDLDRGETQRTHT